MTIKILIVDDEADIRAMLARHFIFNGYEVEQAENGRDALEKLEANGADIIVSDLMMPEMGGVELLQAVHEQYPLVHTIIMTGYVALENAVACLRYGADTCIFKPFEDLKKLDEAVEDAVGKIQHWVDLLNELRGMKPGAAEGTVQ